MSKIKFFVVSISGGGIRGILPAKILNYIQNKLREKSQDDNFHLSSLVDLYAGTSTGSIIALALNLKEDEKFKFLPGDLIQLYLDYGKDIFKQDFIHNLFTLGGLTGPRYSELGLESVIEKFFKDKSLLDLHTNVIIPAHNITQDDPNKVLTFFTSHDAKKKDLNYFLKDVIRASTAAPTYFAPAYFKRINENKEYFGESTGYIDGGVFANCPALCAFIESFKINKDLTMDEIFVLNIGTGWVTKKRNYQEIKSYGAGQWVINILDILMNNTVELTEYQLQKIYEITGLKDNFQSIDFELEDGKDKMDDASDESLQYLLSVADKEIIKNKEKLDWICDVMYNKEV